MSMSTYDASSLTRAQESVGGQQAVEGVRPVLAATPEFQAIPETAITVTPEVREPDVPQPEVHQPEVDDSELAAPQPTIDLSEPEASTEQLTEQSPDLVAEEASETPKPLSASALAAAERAKLGPTGRPRQEFPEPEPLTSHGPARILAICNQKGGVGKTTTTINLGAALTTYGRRVLLVDLDPQGALSVGLGVKPSGLEVTVKDILIDPSIPTREALLKTTVPGMDLLPADIDLAAAEVALVSEVGRERFVATALAQVSAEYDFILIDCQPSLGLLTVNALAAAHGVLIPLECEFFALRGVDLLLDTMRKVVARINPQLQIEGLLPTMFDARTLHTREVVSVLVEKYGDAVFHTAINRTVKFPDASVAGEPITRFAPSSSGSIAYRELAKEVLAR